MSQVEINYCSKGMFQSPIEINSSQTQVCRSKCNLLFYYRGSRCNIVRSGRTLLLNYDGGSHLVYNGNIYELERISFTSPASHIIDKTKGAMECQLYHKAPDTGKILVLSIILEVNEASSPSKAFFDNWTYLIPTSQDKEVVVNMASEWNIFTTLPEIKSFFVYDGSLIQQPCTEGVVWIVMSKFANISDQSYKKILSVIGDNARQVQPTNSRAVLFNPNSSNKNNLNQSNPITCLTEAEMRDKCMKMFQTSENKKQTYGNPKLLMSIIIIMVFLFVLLVVVSYKFGLFEKLKDALKPVVQSAVEIKGIGQA